jgi:NAD(P)-dependent dehydrogenase (short-subunit alcohol dehydrogenase family)
MTCFTGKHAVITGGTSGIGRATALRLRDEGARVLVTGRDAARLAAIGTQEGITAVLDDAAGTDAGHRLRAAVDSTSRPGRCTVPQRRARRVRTRRRGRRDRGRPAVRHHVRGPLLQLAALDSALAPGAAVRSTPAS